VPGATVGVVAGQRGGGCEIRTREGLPPTRFPTMLARVHRRPPPSANCANTIWVNIGERSRTGVNETETETRGRRPTTGRHGRGASPGKGRGDLAGAEPGPGPGRPSQLRRAGLHAPVLLRRWLAPVPVHVRRRYTAVTECKVTNLAGGHESRLTPIRNGWAAGWSIAARAARFTSCVRPSPRQLTGRTWLRSCARSAGPTASMVIGGGLAVFWRSRWTGAGRGEQMDQPAR
jgi:hypothetical protein